MKSDVLRQKVGHHIGSQHIALQYDFGTNPPCAGMVCPPHIAVTCLRQSSTPIAYAKLSTQPLNDMLTLNDTIM